MRKIFSSLSILLMITCSGKKAENVSNDFSPAVRLAKVDNKRLNELSGLAASIANVGMLWAHNDSGNTNEVFLINENMEIVMTCILKGIKNRDWEDTAVGPGPEAGKNYIYIGDIGDNDSKHRLKYVYRFEEPVLNQKGEIRNITNVDVITFTLNGKKKDTESLFIDPNTKHLYVVSKREKPVHVYELKYPQSLTDTLLANSVVTLPLTQITAADFSADGKGLLLKNYEHVYYWKNNKNKSIPELLKEIPYEVPYEVEPQGEAVAWARNGSGFYTISEKNFGKDSYLYFYKRK